MIWMTPHRKSWRRLRLKGVSLKISKLITAFTALWLLPVSAFADDMLVSLFESSCITALKSDDTGKQSDVKRGWIPVSANVDPSLQSYFSNIENMLDDQMRDINHFGRFIGPDFVFLTRYEYEGYFGASSEYCVVSHFSRDDWTLPLEFQKLLDGKIIDIPHSVITIDGQKSVGHWRSQDLLLPISRVTASAFPKNGSDHEASGFYGLQMTAIRPDKESIFTFN